MSHSAIITQNSTFPTGVNLEGWGIAGNSRQKETPEPLNRKRPRKGFRGLRGETAISVAFRQIQTQWATS